MCPLYLPRRSNLKLIRKLLDHSISNDEEHNAIRSSFHRRCFVKKFLKLFLRRFVSYLQFYKNKLLQLFCWELWGKFWNIYLFQYLWKIFKTISKMKCNICRITINRCSFFVKLQFLFFFRETSLKDMYKTRFCNYKIPKDIITMCIGGIEHFVHMEL